MKLKEPEWLFKQGIYGTEHVIVNYGEYLDYMKAGNFQAELRIDTLCLKNLKFNPTYSTVRHKDGVVRNLCPDCWDLIDVRAFKREQAQADLPF